MSGGGVVTGLASRVRGAWESWWGRGVPGGAHRSGAHREVLSPAVAYDLWAPSYGTPPTPLQEIESAAWETLLPNLWGARVLDVGCGTGRLTWEALRRGAALAVGLDPSAAMLERAARLCGDDRARWVGGRAEALPFADGSFDAVLCTLVLGHVPDLEAALAELTRVTASSSRATILISDFHPAAIRRGWERTFVDKGTGRSFRVEQHLHPLESYERLLGKDGFEIDERAEPAYEGTPVAFVLRARRKGGR